VGTERAHIRIAATSPGVRRPRLPPSARESACRQQRSPSVLALHGTGVNSRAVYFSRNKPPRRWPRRLAQSGDERDGPVVGAFPARIPPFGIRVLWANVAQTRTPNLFPAQRQLTNEPQHRSPDRKTRWPCREGALPAKAPASIQAASLIGGDRDCRLIPSIQPRIWAVPAPCLIHSC
jgi:hypothetical protein